MSARLLISAAHKSSGKTMVTLGLCAALRARGLDLRPFKKGPDYIDPLWLSAAAGRVCRNLDFHTMDRAEIVAHFRRHGDGGDLALIEGNKGLYDGADPEGGDSSAALARLLRAPVVLVIDCAGITGGIAPLLLGYCRFDRRVRIEGVILNKVGGLRHEAKLRAAIRRHCGVPVLGAIMQSERMAIAERHLGLIPANELAGADARIGAIAAAIAAQVDLDAVLAVAAGAGAAPGRRPKAAAPVPAPFGRVAYPRDAAFAFYYPEDLEALAAEGLAPVPFDSLRESRLPPDIDGLFLGGGFPEAHMEALAANRPLLGDIRAKVAAGLPVHAECGGLMLLTRAIAWNGGRCEMVGALDAEAVMFERPQGHGNVILRETADAPLPLAGRRLVGHEFHHAGLVGIGPEARFAYRVERGHGIDGRHDGLVHANVLAAFTHLRAVGPDPWPRRFAALIRRRHLSRPVAVRSPLIVTGGLSPCPHVIPSTPVKPFAPAR